MKGAIAMGAETPNPPDPDALAALEHFVVGNDDLFDLESRLGRFNVFDALRVAQAEIRHSNFLAFILDPTESHGLGQLFLRAVMMDLLKSAPEKRPFSPIELDGADLRDVEVAREEDNIDLLVKCPSPSFVIAIENKVSSHEHSDQLRRYKEKIRLRYSDRPALYVYLTPDGEEPSDDDWVPYSYADIHRVLTRVQTTYDQAIGEDVRIFLEHYLRLIGTRFMNDPTIDSLCQRIYRNHRIAIDLIVERGKPPSGVLAEAAAVLREDPRWHVFNQSSKYIAFVPKAWLDWLPSWSTETDDGRSWIILRLYLQEKMLDFIVQVRGMQARDRRKAIVQSLIDGLPRLGFRPSRGGKGEGNRTRVSGADCVVKRSEDSEPAPETVREAVKKKLDEVYPKLEGVRALLNPLLI